MSATFSGFDHGDRVVINRPGTELHGRAATVRNATMLLENGTYVPAYGITCDISASTGQHSFVMRVAHLLLEGAEVIGRYPTAAAAHVTVTTTTPDVATAAPGWVAMCGGCEWTDDQYACWHELWPAYPNIAGGDVRGLLLDTAQEHADTCEKGAAR